MAEYLELEKVLDDKNIITVQTREYGSIEVIPVDTITDIELADAKPVKRGKWDFIGHQLFKCTNCTKIYTQKQLEDIGENWDFPDFCPKCGADMRNDSNFKETEGKVLAVGLGSSFKDSLIKTEVEGLFPNFEQEE